MKTEFDLSGTPLVDIPPKTKEIEAVGFDGVLTTEMAHHSQAEWLQKFAQYDCQASAVNQLTDLTSDIQVTLNEYITEHDDPLLGKQKVVGFPVTLGETPMRISCPAPLYGEHTEQVLQELGGYSWADIVRLKEGRVIL